MTKISMLCIPLQFLEAMNYSLVHGSDAYLKMDCNPNI